VSEQVEESVTLTLSEDERRTLARIAMMREYPTECDVQMPAWIGEIAALGPASFDTTNQLMHAGLLVWSDGWRLTKQGWQALEATAPTNTDP